MSASLGPAKQGLYDPQYEHDACGVGFIVDLKGRKSHQLVQDALQILLNLEHRGACGCEANTGDGAGILLQTPHGFLSRECARLGIELPAPDDYGVAMIFLPTAEDDRRHCEAMFEEVVREEGQHVLGWRTVPTDGQPLGPTARSGEPVVRQLFIGRAADFPAGTDTLAFERKLYVIRRRVENLVRQSNLQQRGMFYVPSLSHKTLIYKGMLTPGQLTAFYP